MDLKFIDYIAGAESVQNGDERIIKEFPAPFIQNRLSCSVVPWYCLWELNTICNLSCKMCYLPDSGNPGPDIKNIQRILGEIISSGIFYIGLMGGEPLLHPYLEYIISELRKEGIYTKIITNGIMLTYANACLLQSSCLNQVEISFDGLTRETHEYSRGDNTFNKAILAIKNAKDAMIPRVGIVWTVNDLNYMEIEKLPAFMHENGVKECYISLFKKTGLAGHKSSLQPLSDGEISYLINRADILQDKNQDLIITLLRQCTCGKTSMIIGYNGDIRPCSFSYSGAGNIADHSLMDLWTKLSTDENSIMSLGYCNNRHLQIQNFGN